MNSVTVKLEKIHININIEDLDIRGFPVSGTDKTGDIIRVKKGICDCVSYMSYKQFTYSLTYLTLRLVNLREKERNL